MASIQHPPVSGGDQVVVGTNQIAGTAIFSNSNNVSFGVTNGTITATAGPAGPVALQGSGTSIVTNGTVQFANSNGVTFGLSGSTITASAVGGAGPAAISAGAASVGAGTVVFSNSNGVSFGANGSTVTASHNGVTAAPAAISAGAASVGAGTVVFSNSNNVSFGLNGSTVTASASAAAAPNMSHWVNNVMSGNQGVNIATLQSAQFFGLNDNLPMPGAMTLNSMGIAVSGATNTSTVAAHTLSVSVGLYVLSNSTRLSLINSVSSSIGTNASVDSAFQSWYAGVRHLTFASSQWSAQPVVTAGGSYWMAIGVQTSGSTQALSFMGQQRQVAGFSGVIGSSFTNRPANLFYGAYSVTSASLPTSVSIGEVLQMSAPYNVTPAVIFVNGISWMP